MSITIVKRNDCSADAAWAARTANEKWETARMVLCLLLVVVATPALLLVIASSLF